MKLKEETLQAPILTEIVSNLVEAYEPLTIYLFGSRARGEAGPDIITINESHVFVTEIERLLEIKG